MNNKIKSNLYRVFDKFMMHKFNSVKNTYGIEFKDIKLISIKNEEIFFSIFRNDSMNDHNDYFHIGAAGTILDIVTTIAISGCDVKIRKNVSIDMSIQNLSNINGNELIIKCNNFIYNNYNIAMCNADIYNSNILCISSIHTKALIENTWL